MSRWASWIRSALTPTPDEVARVVHGLDPDVLDDVRQVTRPSDDEVQRLLANRAAWAERRTRRGRRRALAAVGAVGVALGMVFAVLLRPVPYGPVAVPLGVPAQMADHTLQLGPSIDVLVDARVVVARADAAGTEVEVIDGRGVFDVDPAGRYRNLVVRAGDTRIEVKGTRFEVRHVHGRVRVSVDRGVVEVRHGGEALSLAAGERWEEPALAMAVVRPLPPVAEVALPEPPVAVVEIQARPVPRPDPVAPIVVPEPEPPPAPVLDPLALRWSEILTRLESESPDDVLPAVEAWLETAPDSDLRALATRTHVDLLADVDPARAVAEADGWLAAHPDDTEILRLRATVARDRLHDCALALPSYRRLTAVDDAGADWAYLGLCALAVGDEDEAQRALDAAMSRGIEGVLMDEVIEATLTLAP